MSMIIILMICIKILKFLIKLWIIKLFKKINKIFYLTKTIINSNFQKETEMLDIYITSTAKV